MSDTDGTTSEAAAISHPHVVPHQTDRTTWLYKIKPDITSALYSAFKMGGARPLNTTHFVELSLPRKPDIADLSIAWEIRNVQLKPISALRKETAYENVAKVTGRHMADEVDQLIASSLRSPPPRMEHLGLVMLREDQGEGHHHLVPQYMLDLDVVASRKKQLSREMLRGLFGSWGDDDDWAARLIKRSKLSHSVKKAEMTPEMSLREYDRWTDGVRCRLSLLLPRIR